MVLRLVQAFGVGFVGVQIPHVWCLDRGCFKLDDSKKRIFGKWCQFVSLFVQQQKNTLEVFVRRVWTSEKLALKC